MEEQTNLFGIPVPSTNKIFLAFVVIHIFLALICLISGLIAMLSEKGRGTHLRAGRVYFRVMFFVFFTIVVLSIMRWPHNIHLLCIGTLALACSWFGQRLIRSSATNRARAHTVLMGMSYVLLLTGFYVDNGKHLPFWRQFPQWFFWIFPSLAGVPIIILVLLKHPLNRIRNKHG